MFPIGTLPAAALLVRLGQPDLFDVPVVVAVGNAILSNLPLTIGIAIGLAVDASGARLHNGALAGSVLHMNEALRNMREATGASWQELAQMSSYNAAQQLKIPNKGYIAKGKDADFVVVDEQFNVKMTVVQGNIVYARLGGMHVG